MKSKMKGLYKWIAVLAIIIIIAIILCFPGAANAVSKVTGIAASKIRNTAIGVAGVGIGLLLVSMGVGALAVPIVGITLIVIGLAVASYCVWRFFMPTTMTPSTKIGDAGLQNIM